MLIKPLESIPIEASSEAASIIICYNGEIFHQKKDCFAFGQEAGYVDVFVGAISNWYPSQREATL